MRLRFFSMKALARVEDEQIPRSAEALIRTHGDSALAFCAETAQRWLERGDPDAALLWNKFMLACRKLLDGRPGS